MVRSTLTAATAALAALPAPTLMRGRSEASASHWNGPTWTDVPDPLPLSPGTALVGVTDISCTDAYAIGNQGSAHARNVWIVGTYLRTVYGNIWDPHSVHWDGTTWTIVPSPNVGGASHLTSVSASPGAVIAWAAGYSGVSGSFNPPAGSVTTDGA